jgi:hypothetical protein
VLAGVIHTDENGEGHLFLSTAGQPGAEPLPEELQPLTGLQSVEIRDAGGVVLAGEFADARRNDWNHPWLDYLGLAVLQDGEGNFVGFAAAAIDGEEQELKFGLWGDAGSYVVVWRSTSAFRLQHGTVVAVLDDPGQRAVVPGLGPVTVARRA